MMCILKVRFFVKLLSHSTATKIETLFATVYGYQKVVLNCLQIIDTLFATVHQEVAQCMKIQIYQKAGLAKSVKGKVVHLLENGTFTLLGSIFVWAHFGQV